MAGSEVVQPPDMTSELEIPLNQRQIDEQDLEDRIREHEKLLESGHTVIKAEQELDANSLESSLSTAASSGVASGTSTPASATSADPMHMTSEKLALALKTCFEQVGLTAESMVPPYEKDLDEMLKKSEADHARLCKEMHAGTVRITGHEDVDLSKLNKFERKVLAAIGSGHFELRDPLGQIFSRTVGKTNQYKDIKGNAAKESFRTEWFAAQVGSLEEKLEKMRKWSKTEFKNAKYMSFSRIVEAQGGWRRKVDIEAAARICGKCLKMGPPWIRYNEASERVDFMHVEYGFNEAFEESWKMISRWGPKTAAVEDGQNEEPATSASKKRKAEEDVEPQQIGAKAKAAAKSAKKGKAAAGGGGGGGGRGNGGNGGDGGDNSKQTLQAALSAAAKTKKLFHETMQKTQGVMKCIETKEAWAWAKTPQNEGKLKELTQDCEENVSQFADDYFVTDATVLRKRYGKETDGFLAELLEIPRKLDHRLTKLMKTCERLINMHQQFIEYNDGM